MNEALIVGDLHISGKNPPGRKDNLVEKQFIKLQEIVSIANELDVDIISVGDFFDRSNVSYSIFSIVSEILHGLKNKWYLVWGNHDLYMHSIDSRDATTLGALIKAHPKVFAINDLNFEFGYCHWDQSIVKNKSKILISHKSVISPNTYDSNPWMKGNEHDFWTTDSKELKSFNTFICGHWHKQYIKLYQNKWIINPGCINRRINCDNERHRPAVVHYDFNHDQHALMLIELKSGENIEDVMDQTQKEIKINLAKKDTSEFIKSLRLEKQEKSNTLVKQLVKILNSKELDNDLRPVLKDILQRTFEKLEIKPIKFKLKRI